MSAVLALPTLWAQGFLAGVPEKYRALMGWLFVFGEPNFTIPSNTWQAALLAGLITWLKVISLFCLLGWVVGWVGQALKARAYSKINWLDIVALVALVGVVVTVVLWELDATGKIKLKTFGGGYGVVQTLASVWGLLLFVWVEAALAGAIRRARRPADAVVFFGMHLALALGIGVGIAMLSAAKTLMAGTVDEGRLTLWDGLIYGIRISGTYMGYVVLLKVLLQLFREVINCRFRRLYSIALLSITESTRRMWAPWVVITVFFVILAFTHWFLIPPRAAEMGRLYVGALSFLSLILLTVMIVLLAPLSLPQDIQNQTIYTVVSKPVRRIELVWGRMLGFMAMVTALILLFGVISLVYLQRTVGGKIADVEQEALKANDAGRTAEATLLYEQADQLRNRMTARVPVYGALTFLDSKGTPHNVGIDVGQDQGREPRSHIEGGTPATAIWNFGVVPDPRTPMGQQAPLIDRRIPVELFLKSGTVEYLLNEVYVLRGRITAAERERADPRTASTRSQQLASAVSRNQEELKKATAAYEKLKADADSFAAKADAADQAGKADEAASLRKQADEMHSPPVTIEMTFNIYRTTKGRVGEAVLAQIEATNPRTGAKSPRDLFPVREYYTNKRTIPAELLAGSDGYLTIEVQCISLTQYLGMAESDLFLLAQEGNFGTNFMKGLFGVWLQAMVLTGIGVFAGTFLSWPVALLTTIAFAMAGHVLFNSLLNLTMQHLMGGGPFESMIRMLTHDNQMSDLTPTFAVVTAKTLDAIVMPVMSRLVYIVPNFSAMDVSNAVSNGFAVPWALLGANTLLAFAYALPFSVAGYFVLKNREVAA